MLCRKEDGWCVEERVGAIYERGWVVCRGVVG